MEKEICLESPLGKDLAGEEGLCSRMEEDVGTDDDKRMGTGSEATSRMGEARHFVYR